MQLFGHKKSWCVPVCKINWLLQNRTFSGKASATARKIELALPKKQNIFLGKATALNPQILHSVLSCPQKKSCFPDQLFRKSILWLLDRNLYPICFFHPAPVGWKFSRYIVSEGGKSKVFLILPRSVPSCHLCSNSCTQKMSYSRKAGAVENCRKQSDPDTLLHPLK